MLLTRLTGSDSAGFPRTESELMEGSLLGMYDKEPGMLKLDVDWVHGMLDAWDRGEESTGI